MTVIDGTAAKSSQRSRVICTFEDTRCRMPSSMRLQRISRLQGFAPLVSPYRRQSVARLYGGLFFHGLCSPSRSDYASLLPLLEEDRGGFRLAQPRTTRCNSIDCVRATASHPFYGRLGPKTCSELPTLGDAVEVCPTRSVARLLIAETMPGPR